VIFSPLRFRAGSYSMKGRGLALFLLSLYFLIFLDVFDAQAITEVWQRSFGGPGHEEGLSLELASDGGYVVAGLTDSFGFGGVDLLLIKVDEGGSLVWRRSFGGKGDDVASSVSRTKDGCYIVAGWTSSKGKGASDAYVLKVNQEGGLLWERTFGGKGEDFASFAQETSDGGVIVVGGAESFGAGGYDAYVIKLDREGNLVWERAFGGAHYDQASSAQEAPDGGYVVAGVSKSRDTGDAYVFKVDKGGNLVWEGLFGGENYDEASAILRAPSGGYIVVGLSESFGLGGSDVYALRVSESGEKIWERSFGGKRNDSGFSLCRSSKGYLIVGFTESKGRGGSDVYLLELTEDGQKLWSEALGGIEDDRGYSVKETVDGRYIVIAGSTASIGSGGGIDLYLLKLTSPR